MAISLCLTADLACEYALYLLPYLMRVPYRKGQVKSSYREVADYFLQIHPVNTILLCFNLVQIVAFKQRFCLVLWHIRRAVG
jgi:hypothetical protein